LCVYLIIICIWLTILSREISATMWWLRGVALNCTLLANIYDFGRPKFDSICVLDTLEF
jgi:hypothetical protein